MERIKPRTLSGFMELLPADQAKMEKFMETLRRNYSLYGFTALDTPAIEASEVLLAKGGGETEKQIYRFTKGDSDLSLFRGGLTMLRQSRSPRRRPCTSTSAVAALVANGI